METLLAEHSTLGQVVWDTVDVFLNHPTAMGKFSKAGEVLNVSPIKCRRHRDREPSRAPPRLAYTSTQRTGQIDYANASLGLRFSPTSLACIDAEFVVRELRRPRTSLVLGFYGRVSCRPHCRPGSAGSCDQQEGASNFGHRLGECLAITRLHGIDCG